MKTKLVINLILLFVFFSLHTSAQDTLIISNNFKYKLGVKFIADKSNDYSLISTGSNVISGGIQLVRKIGNTKSSIETGVYEFTKAAGVYESGGLIYNNISVPLNYRLDTRIVYISGGIYVDYLVSKHSRYPTFLRNVGQDRKIKFGLNLCLGIEKEINKQLSLLVEARTFNDLTSSKTDKGEFFSPSYSNNGFAVGVNYKFLQ